LTALEIKEGRIKLVLHESTGKFSAYYLTDISDNDYTPLFLDQDPRTTSLSLIIGNKVHRMGESSAFRQSIERTDNGARFVWRSSSVEVSEDFMFISSERSPVTNGFVLKITVKNTSEQSITTEVRYIFDTYLGEESGEHFKTDVIRRVSGETTFTKYTVPEYVLSPSDNPDFDGFQIMTNASGITVPDKMILANWKRLNDATWDYETSAARNFNQLPYSINDSGIALYFERMTIPRGGKEEITLAMGGYANEGFSAADIGERSEISRVFNQTLSSSSVLDEDVSLSVQTDLITINDLLSRINEKIESGDALSGEELEVMTQVILELNKRKQRYAED
jgi:hypothetical protein